MAKKNTSSTKKQSGKKSTGSVKKSSKKVSIKKTDSAKKKAVVKKIPAKKTKIAAKAKPIKKVTTKNQKSSSQKKVVSGVNNSKTSASKSSKAIEKVSKNAATTNIKNKAKTVTSSPPAALKSNVTKTVAKKSAPQAKTVSPATSRKNETLSTAPAALPPGAFELEYVVHASAELLFTFLTEPSGLSEWFCDDVNIRNGIYTFFWDGTQQQAREVKVIQDKVLRMQWMDKSDETYFEYRIEKDDLTSDISLIITDFADSPDEKQSSILLWNSQIDKLLHVMGAYF